MTKSTAQTSKEMKKGRGDDPTYSVGHIWRQFFDARTGKAGATDKKLIHTSPLEFSGTGVHEQPENVGTKNVSTRFCRFHYSGFSKGAARRDLEKEKERNVAERCRM